MTSPVHFDHLRFQDVPEDLLHWDLPSVPSTPAKGVGQVVSCPQWQDGDQWDKLVLTLMEDSVSGVQLKQAKDKTNQSTFSFIESTASSTQPTVPSPPHTNTRTLPGGSRVQSCRALEGVS